MSVPASYTRTDACPVRKAEGGAQTDCMVTGVVQLTTQGKGKSHMPASFSMVLHLLQSHTGQGEGQELQGSDLVRLG